MADKSDPAACPVDHKTRDAWLAQARAAEAAKAQTPSAACPVDHTSQASPPSKSWTQTLTSYLPWSSGASSPVAPATSASPAPPHGQGALGENRVISTIPRLATGSAAASACPVDHGASANAPNAEIESGVDASGNWVYPSEKMFFEAMKRKGYDARATDMKTVVPIHNAVNERAWQQIKEWEAPYLAQSKCVFFPRTPNRSTLPKNIEQFQVRAVCADKSVPPDATAPSSSPLPTRAHA